MAKQNLIDTLFDEFGRYKYWSMRALRERLMQPEAWLKECLLEVAEQEQDGPYKSKLIAFSIIGRRLIHMFQQTCTGSRRSLLV
jgi:hypothetical protein